MRYSLVPDSAGLPPPGYCSKPCSRYGSGDVLAGIAATLLAQTGDSLVSGACSAWIHGRAGEIANAGRPVRGVTVTDVLDGLGHAWRLTSHAAAAPVMVELPGLMEFRAEAFE